MTKEQIMRKALEDIRDAGRWLTGPSGGGYEGAAGIADDALKAIVRIEKAERREKEATHGK